jgi:hypothetical protein
LKRQCANSYLSYISANAAQEKKEKKVLEPTVVSKSVAHTVFNKAAKSCQILQIGQMLEIK